MIRIDRVRRGVLGLLLVLGLVAASACDIVPNPTLAQLLDGGPHGASATVQRDIAYGADTGCFLTDEMCGGSQELDVHRSAVGDARRPVVVWVHGGAWVRGDKALDIPGNVLRQLDRGWDVVSVNYRLAPRVQFPTPVQDVKLAVRWVRAHAAEYGWNPDRIVIAGHSAGGNLAAMVGTTAGVDELEPHPTGELAHVSSAVAAAVSVSGVLDLADTARRDPYTAAAVVTYVGCASCTAIDRAGPGWWIGPDDAPLYLVQGTNDWIVSTGPAISTCLAAMLRKLPCTIDLVDTGPPAYLGHDASATLNQSALESFIDRAGR